MLGDIEGQGGTNVTKGQRYMAAKSSSDNGGHIVISRHGESKGKMLPNFILSRIRVK